MSSMISITAVIAIFWKFSLGLGGSWRQNQWFTKSRHMLIWLENMIASNIKSFKCQKNGIHHCVYNMISLFFWKPPWIDSIKSV